MFKLNKLRNEGTGYLVFQIFNLFVMLVILMITLVPYLNVLAKSLNDGTDSMRGGITIYPRVFTLENYGILLKDSSLKLATIVTLLKVILSVIGSVLVQFMTAYALAKRGLKGAKIINLYFLIPMYVSGGLIPLYILYSNIGLLNNFWVYVLPALWNFYNIIIIRSYIESSISESILEAARIDGAQEWTLFSRIVLPLCKPILATIVLWVAVNAWNEWTTTLYFIQNPELHTLQYKLMQTLKESERLTALLQEAVRTGGNIDEISKRMKVTPDSMQAAQIIVVTLPIIAVYPFLQKHFVKGVTLGSVKG